MRLLLTGSARSGSGYLAHLLRAAGVDAGWESTTPPKRFFAADGGSVQQLHVPEWRHEVEVSSGFAPVVDIVPVPVLGHFLRHPQHVVASIVGRGMFATEWGAATRGHYQELNLLSDPFDMALAYWVIENARVHHFGEQHPYYRKILLSDPLPALLGVLDVAGVEVDEDELRDLEAMFPQDVNHYPGAPPVNYDWYSHEGGWRHAAEQLWEVWTGERIGQLASAERS